MKKIFFLAFAVFVLSVSVFADSGDLYFSTNSLVINELSGLQRTITIQSIAPNTIYYFNKINSVGGNSTFGLSTVKNAVSRHTYSDNGDSVDVLIKNDFADGWYVNSILSYSSGATTYDPSLTSFPANASNADIVAALEDYIANPPAPTPAVSSSFTLPRGNVLYFQVATESDVNFISEFNRLSNIVTIGNSNPWGDTGAAFGPAAALPSADTKFPIASMDTIAWQKYGAKNILGQTKTGSVLKHCIIGQWYALYNPSFAYISEQMRDAVGGTITASGSFAQIKVYPLNQELSFENGISGFNSNSSDGYASYYDGTVDSETGDVTFTNQDGVVSEPVNGGQNYQEPAISAVGLIEQVKQTLANILTEIENLFTFGYSAIGSLVGLMSQFVNSLGQLYSWLPSEVYSAIMSAVIVAIVIGVFKVFL